MTIPHISTNNEQSNSRMPRPHRYDTRSTRPPYVTAAPQNILDGLEQEQYNSLETVHVSQEAPWDEQGDELLRRWMADAEKQSILHRKRGFYLKKLYRVFNILSIVAASVVFFMGRVTFSTDETIDQLGHSVFTFINLILANLNSFLDFGPLYQKHFEFEGKYTKVCIELEEIIATDQEYRVPKDRTLAEYKEIVGNLYTSAPEV